MMRNKNRLFACLTFVALLATMQPLFAEPKPKTWYQIEVLIYEPIRQTTANEHWPSVLDENTPRSSIDLSPVGRSTTHKAFQKLPPEALTLNAKAKRLAGSRKYRLITLQGWQQPVKQRQEAVAVHLADKTRVDGEVTVSLSRYLHMALNIRLQSRRLPCRTNSTTKN